MALVYIRPANWTSAPIFVLPFTPPPFCPCGISAVADFHAGIWNGSDVPDVSKTTSCQSQRCSSFTAVKQVSVSLDSHDQLKYQPDSLTMQLRRVSFLIYSFTCPSSEGKTNSNWKGSLFQLQLQSCVAALPLSDD